MAGSAVAVVLLSAVALLCLYHLLFLSLSVPDPAAAAAVPRRAGGHHGSNVPSGSGTANVVLRFGLSGQPLRLHDPASAAGLPDIDTFRGKLERLLPPDDHDPGWSRRFDAELGPVHRYFGPDAPLDVRQRIAYLFAILDRSPRGVGVGVGVGELEAWLRWQAAARLDAVTRREMAPHDTDRDGAVTLREFFADKMGWWMHKFASADRDGDGSLNAVEFNDFLHPEDSSQESVMLWLLKDKLSEMDHDGDGRLSQEEFVAQSHIIISGARHADDGGHAHDLERAEAAKKFTELDADKDNYLTVEEARCVLQSLVTGEFSYATSHAKFLMKADVNHDGKLSLEEMLDDYISFYSTVYMDDHYASEGEVDSDSRDEL
uniref:EF-hand domain-containing protein n=1 Tax=Zea mays TaxID=4577 RepID=B4FZK9_MAIZE|nr:unknown [Zea mays]|eukprot:NP_001142054.1 Calcium-binding EF hand family protein precursor [Zea mays]